MKTKLKVFCFGLLACFFVLISLAEAVSSPGTPSAKDIPIVINGIISIYQLPIQLEELCEVTFVERGVNSCGEPVRVFSCTLLAKYTRKTHGYKEGEIRGFSNYKLVFTKSGGTGRWAGKEGGIPLETRLK